MNIGDKVRLIETTSMDEEYGLKVGDIGVVISSDINGCVLVRFENFKNGHGGMNDPDADDAYWYVDNYRLEIAQ